MSPLRHIPHMATLLGTSHASCLTVTLILTSGGVHTHWQWPATHRGQASLSFKLTPRGSSLCSHGARAPPRPERRGLRGQLVWDAPTGTEVDSDSV